MKYVTVTVRRSAICNLQKYLKAVTSKELSKNKMQLPWLLSHLSFTAPEWTAQQDFPGEPWDKSRKQSGLLSADIQSQPICDHMRAPAPIPPLAEPD